MGIRVDVFTRSQDEHVPHVLHELGYGNRVVHIPAGPEKPSPSRNWQPTSRSLSTVSSSLPEKGITLRSDPQSLLDVGPGGGGLIDAWEVPIVQMFHTLGEMKNRVATQRSREREGEYRIDGERQVLHGLTGSSPPPRLSIAQLAVALPEPIPRKVVVIPPGVDSEPLLSHPGG